MAIEKSTALSKIIEANVSNGKTADLKQFKANAVVNATDSVYDKDLILHIPALGEIVTGQMGIDEFKANGRVFKAPYLWVDCELNGVAMQPKKLFMSQLVRSVRKYEERDGKFEPTGDPIHSDTELYKALCTCRNSGDILEGIAGKDLQVKKHITGKTASYTNGVITGLRDFSIPCFEEVVADADPKKEEDPKKEAKG